MYLFPLDTSNSKLILHPKNDRKVTVKSNSNSIFIGAATSSTFSYEVGRSSNPCWPMRSPRRFRRHVSVFCFYWGSYWVDSNFFWTCFKFRSYEDIKKKMDLRSFRLQFFGTYSYRRFATCLGRPSRVAHPYGSLLFKTNTSRDSGDWRKIWFCTTSTWSMPKGLQIQARKHLGLLDASCRILRCADLGFQKVEVLRTPTKSPMAMCLPCLVLSYFTVAPAILDVSLPGWRQLLQVFNSRVVQYRHFVKQSWYTKSNQNPTSLELICLMMQKIIRISTNLGRIFKHPIMKVHLQKTSSFFF